MRSLLFMAALSLAALAGCSKSEPAQADTSKAEQAKLPTMTVDEVATQLAAKQIQPVDCNGDKTRKREGVVPGAILISDEESYAASELPADKHMKLVFYCANPG